MADLCEASQHPQPGERCDASGRTCSEIVEAPGVEAGGGECGLVMSRDVSSREGPESREKRGAEGEASSVSCGLVESRCSSEVRAASEGSDSTSEPRQAPPEPPAVPLSANAPASARLAALEHLVDVVVALLDAGEPDRARSLAVAWKDSRP
jgi:hypothetical protein